MDLKGILEKSNITNLRFWMKIRNNLQKVNMEQREIIYGMIPTLRVTGLQNFVIPRALVRQVTLTPHQHQVAFQNSKELNTLIQENFEVD